MILPKNVANTSIRQKKKAKRYINRWVLKSRHGSERSHGAREAFFFFNNYALTSFSISLLTDFIILRLINIVPTHSGSCVATVLTTRSFDYRVSVHINEIREKSIIFRWFAQQFHDRGIHFLHRVNRAVIEIYSQLEKKKKKKTPVKTLNV